ncbi:hypothetical protein QQZ08_011360 [Neonectria magnoliae]|uniref:Uncharacterized protein n=1 Tax=Neonectria magnoliae TaxID=2732573 RepID=A0ABR1HB99_9HYPO
MLRGAPWIVVQIEDATIRCTGAVSVNNTTILHNLDRDSFCAEYKEVMVEAGGPALRSTILIHLENDPAAAKVFKIVSSVPSL